MAGTAVEPPPSHGGAASSSHHLLEIGSCCELLCLHLRHAPNHNLLHFFNVCLSLASAVNESSNLVAARQPTRKTQVERLQLEELPIGIDNAVANKEVPSRVRDLPILFQQVCKLKHDSFLRAAILVLMISVKNACRSAWFSDEQSTELCLLADEILSSFCTSMNFNTEPNIFQSTISTIISRYYPRMKMGKILAFLEVKPGYGTYVHDFQFSKDVKSSEGERIRLFVAQADNMETSSCLINPITGNFLLNGKGVERRNNNFMDPGPQMPSSVNLKYGTNLLQAVGQFDGNYIIVIAFMSMGSTPDHSMIQDYVQPSNSMIDPDSEVIEGPSRISLNCPISFKRIDVPAKGRMCKHRQCFDYQNYMEINSRRPSWRCPHCNQHVCFMDLRIDQIVVKVLNEIGETASDVTISSDGSWKAIMESDDQCDKPQDKSSISLPTEIVQVEASADLVGDMMDLTVDDYAMDTLEISGIEDRKVSGNAENVSNVQNHNTVAPIEDDFWSGIFLSSSSQLVPEIVISQPSFDNLVSPVLNDTCTPALNGEAGPFRGNSQVVTCPSQNQICSSNSLQLQQSQHGNSVFNNEYSHISSIPRHNSRTPVAVQSLPVQPSTSVYQQRPRNHLMIENSPSIAPQMSTVPTIGDTISSVHNNIERQQQCPAVEHNQNQTHVALSRLQQYLNPQTVGRQSPSQVQSSYRVPGSSQQPQRMRQSATSSSPQLYQGGPPTSGTVGNHQAPVLASQHATMMERPADTSTTSSHYPMSVHPVNTNELRTANGIQRESTPSSQPSLGDAPMEVTTEQNWRPSGRMRGSLSGRAYLDAFNHYIIRTTPQPQAGTHQGQTAAPIPIPRNYSAAQLELFMANAAALNEARHHPRTTTDAWSHRSRPT